MAKNKFDLEIGVNYDPAGARRAAEDMKQVAAAAEEAEGQTAGSGAAEGLQATGEAAAEATEALSEETAQAEELTEALEKMGEAGVKAQEELAEASEAATEALAEEAAQAEELAEALDETGERGEKFDISAGAREQKEVLSEVAAALSDVAEKMRQASAESQQEGAAHKGAAAAAQDEATRTKVLAEQLKLEALSKRALTAEVQRLAAARKAAAQAGDEQAFQRLTSQYKQAKGALTQMTQAANLQKAALMGQASAGMQFANTLGSLGQQLKSGQVDLAGMANGVMSLGMALKAGLGPVGWAMAAIQGLSMAIDYLSNRQEKAAQEAEEHAQAQAQAAQQFVAAQQQLAAVVAEAYQAETQRELDKMEMEEQRARRQLQRDKKRADAKRKEAQDYANYNLKLQEETSRADVALGIKTAEQVSSARRRLEDEERTRQQKADEDEVNERLKLASRERKRAGDILQELENQDGKLAEEFGRAWQMTKDENLLTLVSEVETVKKEIEAGQAKLVELKEKRKNAPDWEKEGIERELENTRDSLKDSRSFLSANMKRIGYLLGGIGADAEEEYANFKQACETRGALDKKVNEARQRLSAAIDAESDLSREQREIQDRDESQNKIAEAKRKADEAEKLQARREEKWASLQQENYAEQEKYAREVLNSMKEGSEAYKKWAKRAEDAAAGMRQEEWKDVQKKALDVQREWLRRTIETLPEESKERGEWLRQIDANEAAQRMKGWAEAQHKTLAEQQKYVERMLAATQEGTQEWEKWAEQSRNLANKKVLDELGRLHETYKTSRNYAEVDLRTEAQKLAEDRRALLAARKWLQKQLAAPNLDADTQRKLNDELKQTQKALIGYKLSCRAAAAEAAHSLKNLEMPDLSATNKQLQGNVKRAQKAFERLSKRYERAAAKGDTKAMAQLSGRMKKLAWGIEKATGFSGEMAKVFEAVVEQGKKLKEAGLKGATEEEVKRADVRQRLGLNRKKKKAPQEPQEEKQKEPDNERKEKDSRPSTKKPKAKDTEGKKEPELQQPQQPSKVEQTDLSRPLEQSAAAATAMQENMQKALPLARSLTENMKKSTDLMAQMIQMVQERDKQLGRKLTALNNKLETMRKTL